MSARIDIKGRIFHDVLVLEFEEQKNTHAKWKCLCMICNEVIYVTYSNLKSGNTKSCQKCGQKMTTYKQEAEIIAMLDSKDSIANIAKHFNFERNVVYRVRDDEIKWRGINMGA
ncbi:MAG: hypothetical protein Q9M43_07250 [Sulfurimonas sp.]|nr:hypothetical protein [Sulfurimonas sp.]